MESLGQNEVQRERNTCIYGGAPCTCKNPCCANLRRHSHHDSLGVLYEIDLGFAPHPGKLCTENCDGPGHEIPEQKVLADIPDEELVAIVVKAAHVANAEQKAMLEQTEWWNKWISHDLRGDGVVISFVPRWSIPALLAEQRERVLAEVEEEIKTRLVMNAGNALRIIRSLSQKPK